jgi:hypothetical protein
MKKLRKGYKSHTKGAEAEVSRKRPFSLVESKEMISIQQNKAQHCIHLI